MQCHTKQLNMNEKPIIFSGPMVRAILDGRKTQTRRVVKPQPDKVFDGSPWKFRHSIRQGHSGHDRLACPYGVPGDRLWVREAWSLDPCPGPNYRGGPMLDKGEVMYRATDGWAGPWRPSIHMPRRASRITLEVTKVRVERLEQISEGDAVAEGARKFDELEPSSHRYANPAKWSMEENRTKEAECLTSARWAFANYWEKLNAKRSPWSSNPWVWVVEFKRLPSATKHE